MRPPTNLQEMLRQAESLCTEADMTNITAVGMPSSLADRLQLIRMLEVTTRGCVRCILQTVASVCGDDCVNDRLHIRTGQKPFHDEFNPFATPF
jgi:hypothetical protein